MTSTELDRTLDLLDSTRSLKVAQNVIWESFMGKRCTKYKCSKMRIALLNAPCAGFGDVIFAQKLTKYLKEWYGATVHIFTTLPGAHIKLGENPKNLIKPIGTKREQCRTFANLNFGKDADRAYDLYFVAPLVANYAPNISEVARRFKFANKTNIFFFSEYNTPVQDFQFPTGVGNKRLGLLMVKPPPMHRLHQLKHPYAVIYIASEDHIARATSCYLSFMEMIAAKYSSKHKKLEVVVPPWIVDELDERGVRNLINKVKRHYPRVFIKDSQGIEELTDETSGNTFTIRGDILPVNNKKMFSLMHYSVKDILLTGDQSITDALSCCSNKNIFYQIASWKESFAKELAKELPDKYLKHKKTSCGTLKALRYNSNYREFIKKWDFRTLARPKMDAVVLGATAIRRSKKFKELVQLINSSRTLRSLKNKADEL
jgi:hypothetical protein